MNLRRVLAKLETRALGNPILFFERVDSTNNIARELAGRDAPEGTLVVAGEQTAGRGRSGRTWHSPPGGLWFSLLLRPAVLAPRSYAFTLIASLAVADSIRKVCKTRGRVRWPNDVTISGRKVCGVLGESQILGDRLDYSILGIGLNSNITPAQLPQEIRAVSTTLKQQYGSKVDQEKLLADIILRFEKMYLGLHEPDKYRIAPRFARFDELYNKLVAIECTSRTVAGRAAGIDENGQLKILTQEGNIRLVQSEEVTRLVVTR